MNDGRRNAVLHVTDDRRGYNLAVWVEEHAQNIVISLRACLDAVGTDDVSIDDQEIEDYILPDLQDKIDEVVRELHAFRAANDR